MQAYHPLAQTGRVGQRGGSAAIVGVDRDVPVGEIASPHRGSSVAEAEVDFNIDLPSLQVGGDRSLVVVGERQALACRPGAAEADRQLVAVRRLPGLA